MPYISATQANRNIPPMPKVQEPALRFMREWRDVMLLVDKAANLRVVAQFAGQGTKLAAEANARDAEAVVETAWNKLRALYTSLHGSVSVLDSHNKRSLN